MLVKAEPVGAGGRLPAAGDPQSPLLPAPPTAFDPACHHRDGTFVIPVTPARCPWRSGTNPLIRPFNR